MLVAKMILTRKIRYELRLIIAKLIIAQILQLALQILLLETLRICYIDLIKNFTLLLLNFSILEGISILPHVYPLDLISITLKSTEILL